MELPSQSMVVALAMVVGGAGCASSESAQRNQDPAGYMQQQQARERASAAQAAGEQSTLVANDGLCPLRARQRANTEIDTEVDQQEQTVVVELTTDDSGSVQDLRDQASELARAQSYRLGPEAREEAVDEETAAAAAPATVPVDVTSQDIEDGTRLTFMPTDASNVEPLYAQLQQDAEAVEQGQCTVPTPSAGTTY